MVEHTAVNRQVVGSNPAWGVSIGCYIKCTKYRVRFLGVEKRQKEYLGFGPKKLYSFFAWYIKDKSEYNINGKWSPFQGEVLGSSPSVRKNR